MTPKTQINPVGKIVAIPGLDNLVASMQAAWSNLQKQLGTVPWGVVAHFLVQCLDNLISYVVQHDIPGEDKKATVLAALGKLYDWVVAPMLPFWVRPFAARIRDFVLNVAASAAIDWIVSKYKDGSWKPQVAK